MKAGKILGSLDPKIGINYCKAIYVTASFRDSYDTRHDIEEGKRAICSYPHGLPPPCHPALKKKKTPSAMLNYATSARDTLDLAVSKRKTANPPVLITESDLKPCADFVFLFLFLL